MAPSGNNNTSKTKPTPTRRRRKSTRQSKNKKKQQQEIIATSVLSSTKEEKDHMEISEVINDVSNSNNSSVCSTPKGQKFRIPEISTCPPAPKKKQRVLSNCSLRRLPLSFFTPPDLEHFFLVALRDVPV